MTKKSPPKTAKPRKSKRGGKRKTVWMPTAAQTKLLTALLNPKNAHLTICDLCEVAGINRHTYYEAFKKPEFVAYYREISKALITQAVAPIINSSIRQAKLGNFNHTKLLLEMENMHQDSLAITGADRGPIITKDMTAKDAARRYAEIVKGKKGK